MKTILSLTQWETRVSECFSRTNHFQWCQARHLDFMDTFVHAELNRKHGKRAVYPTFTQGYVRGLCRAHDADMMRNYIEFCYIVDGIMYSVDARTVRATTRDYCDKVNPDGGGALLCRDDTPRGLFWRDSDKRFF